MQIEARLQEGIAAHKKGDLETAQDAYIDVLKADPEHADGLHFLGLLHFNAGKPDNAIELINRSLELDAKNAPAYNNLGNILKLQGERQLALEAYVKAVELQPDIEEAWKNINVLLHGSKRNEELLPVLAEITRLTPDNAQAWHNYALSLLLAEQKEKAADALETCLTFDKSNWTDPTWHARILCTLGRRDRALPHIEKVVAAAPDNESAQYLLAVARGDRLDIAPQGYVKKLFDDFSETFDDTLRGLRYQAPELVAGKVVALADANGSPFRDVVDLGCGTGLCGPLIRDTATRLTGVDLSAGMLEKSAKLNVYDYLVEGELVAFMNADLPTCFDLAVCADTLCYLGDLQAFMSALFDALKPGGYLVASVERLDDTSVPDYQVGVQGRYAHRPDYVRQCAEDAGLTYVDDKPAVLRLELAKEVHGLIFTLNKPLASPA